MNRYLCISITFLDPFFHGRLSADEPEWPPSPYRLYQALLAGAKTGCHKREWGDAKRQAFRWLQDQKPPLILAPSIRRSLGYTLFVPNNDSDKILNRQDRLTTKVVRPSRLMDEAPLSYLWKIQDHEWAQSRQNVEILCEEARHILAFGWGIDMVVGNGRVLDHREVAELPGVRWTPRAGHPSSNTSVRRVPKHGTLDDLETCYESFVESIKGKVYRAPQEARVFDRVIYIQDSQLPPRPYVAFELRDERHKWVQRRQVASMEVAAMLRHQACQAAKLDSHNFPGGSELYVAGHAGNREETPERFSYIPLPTIGHPHADGLIRRVLIAEPHGSNGSHAQWAESRLRNRELNDDAGAPRGILVAQRRHDDVLDAYVRAAQSWFSVTPVILPGYDDGKHTKAEKLVMKAIVQAGISFECVEEISIRKAPHWPGSQHPKQYLRPSYLNHLPGWHVLIRFREAVYGPIVIGAGRHCGLGVFAAEK